MNFKRHLSLKKLVHQHSHFLFGPRACGKSYLVDKELSQDAYIIDLLDNNEYAAFLEKPSRLQKIAKENQYVVIDEVQRIPQLLNEVHITCNEKIPCNFYSQDQVREN